MKLKKLNVEERKLFKSAEGSEWGKIVENRGAEDRSLKEGQRIEEDAIEKQRVIGSRFVYTKKDLEEGGWKAKARWIAQGFSDPDLMSLETYSPTLTGTGLCAFYKWSRRWNGS